MKRCLALFLTLVMCLTLCACGNGVNTKKVEAQLDGTAWSSVFDNTATDGTEHVVGWAYIFYDGNVTASMAVATPGGEPINLGTANGAYEIGENAIQITWNEVENQEGMSTIWENGGTETLRYTYENGVLSLFAIDGSEMKLVE